MTGPSGPAGSKSESTAKGRRVKEGKNVGTQICRRQHVALALLLEAFELAEELQCDKLAFGHHKDDLIETFFLNIFYGASISTMMPVQKFFDGRLTVVRPLYMVDEKMIEKFSESTAWPPIDLGCPTAGSSKREEVKEMLRKGTHFYPMWNVREKGIEWLCNELHHAYDGTDAVYVHFDMDVIGGAGPAPGDILGGLAQPIGMTDYEVLRLSYEIGKRGFNALSFICIPPGSRVIYRLIVYVIMYMLAGKVHANK